MRGRTPSAETPERSPGARGWGGDLAPPPALPRPGAVGRHGGGVPAPGPVGQSCSRGGSLPAPPPAAGTARPPRARCAPPPREGNEKKETGSGTGTGKRIKSAPGRWKRITTHKWRINVNQPLLCSLVKLHLDRLKGKGLSPSLGCSPFALALPGAVGFGFSCKVVAAPQGAEYASELGFWLG